MPSQRRWVPRSSWRCSRSSCRCGRRIATPCSTRRSPIRVMRWAPRWPVVGPWRSRLAPMVRWTSPRSTRTTQHEHSFCGATARAIPRANSTISKLLQPGDALRACRCSPMSATSSSHGPHGDARSSNTDWMVSSRFTRCQSDRTSPVLGPGSTRAIRTSSTTSARSVSTPVSWSRGPSRQPQLWPSTTTNTSRFNATGTSDASRSWQRSWPSGRGSRCRRPTAGSTSGCRPRTAGTMQLDWRTQPAPS